MELDKAAHAAGIDRIGAVAHGGTVSSTSKNSRSRGASMNSWLAKPTACSSRMISMPAKLMKVTISPIVARPCTCSQVPIRKIASSVSVVAARVITVTTAHQDSTGICAASSRSTAFRSAVTSASTRAKLCTSATLPSASDARSARSE